MAPWCCLISIKLHPSPHFSASAFIATSQAGMAWGLPCIRFGNCLWWYYGWRFRYCICDPYHRGGKCAPFPSEYRRRLQLDKTGRCCFEELGIATAAFATIPVLSVTISMTLFNDEGSHGRSGITCETEQSWNSTLQLKDSDDMHRVSQKPIARKAFLAFINLQPHKNRNLTGICIGSSTRATGGKNTLKWGFVLERWINTDLKIKTIM